LLVLPLACFLDKQYSSVRGRFVKTFSRNEITQNISVSWSHKLFLSFNGFFHGISISLYFDKTLIFFRCRQNINMTEKRNLICISKVLLMIFLCCNKTEGLSCLNISNSIRTLFHTPPGIRQWLMFQLLLSKEPIDDLKDYSRLSIET